MSAPLRPRRAELTDCEQLVGLIRDYYTYDHITFVEANVRRGLNELLASDAHGRAYLLEVDGSVAGYLLFTFGFDIEFGGRLALLTDLYFPPEHRRRGLGMAALRFLDELLPTLGVHALELQVERGNTAAQALYRSFGFQSLDRIPLSKSLASQ